MDTLIAKELTLSPDLKSCLVNDTLIDLSKNEYLLLQFLMSNQNKVFNRQELLDAVWTAKASVRTVDVAISRLRRKLGETGRYIRTKSGFGYYFSTN